MTALRGRGAFRGAAVLVRRYIPAALAVGAVVALLDLTPTLRAPSVRTHPPLPTTNVVVTTAPPPGR